MPRYDQYLPMLGATKSEFLAPLKRFFSLFLERIAFLY